MTNPAKSTHIFRIFPFVVAAACLVAPVTDASSPVEEGSERSPSEAAAIDVNASGLKIAVDPETGHVVHAGTGARNALSVALEHALNRSAEGLEFFDLPNGGLGVPLESRFQHVVMLKVRPDGSFELECVDSVRKAKDFLHPKAAGADDDTRIR